MKKTSILLIAMMIAIKSFAQVSTLGTTFNLPSDYLGWDATPGGPPLHIKTELAQSIRFYTNAGAGTLNNLRMMIDGTNGFVGIGIDKPLYNLHVAGSFAAENIIILKEEKYINLYNLILNLQEEIIKLNEELSNVRAQIMSIH